MIGRILCDESRTKRESPGFLVRMHRHFIMPAGKHSMELFGSSRIGNPYLLYLHLTAGPHS